jgi:MFS family permease
MQAPPSSGPIFYGWFVVAAAFAVTFIAFGSAYTFSAFFEPLQKDFGASRGSISFVFSLAGFLYFGLGLVSGPLADRYGARPLAIVGMLLVGAGLALAGAARSLAEVYIAYSVGIGLGVGLAYVPVIAAVQKWFVRRRGLASGLAVTGIGVGTLLMPPLASLLIGAFGWRQTYLIFGALAAVIGIGMALLIEDDPRRRGLQPDGEGLPGTSPVAAGPAGVTIREAIRSSAFRSLYAACLICSFGVFVPFVHLTPYALDRGIGPMAASVLLGLVGAGSTAGRLVLGGLADRMGRARFLLAMYVGMALAMAVWAVAASLVPLIAFALVFGLFYGGWVAVLPSVVMDRFGGAHLSGIIGALYTAVAFGTLIGPTAAGYIFDATQSYLLPILLGLAANILAAAITARALSRSKESA